jgi:hypothetical protein
MTGSARLGVGEVEGELWERRRERRRRRPTDGRRLTGEEAEADGLERRPTSENRWRPTDGRRPTDERRRPTRDEADD